LCRQSATVCLTKSPSPRQRELLGPAERLATLPDPRDRRGRPHSLVSVLLTAACAVPSGVRSTLAYVHSLLKSALEHAVREEEIPRNVG
jgi:hypothetical protein